MNCTTCGEPVKRRPYELKKSKNVFCNHDCYAKFKAKQWEGKTNPRWRGGSDAITCKHCGVLFTTKKYGEGRKSKYCSRTCAGQANGEKSSGENHWNWKGGIGTRHLKRNAPPKPDKCEVCGSDANNFKKGLVLDHCHNTKQFRGWLCTNCNTALGLLKEDPNRFELLKNYLLSHQ
jgi:hypothetical protein